MRFWWEFAVGAGWRVVGGVGLRRRFGDLMRPRVSGQCVLE